jgi:K+-sensing histidine kinase KdpD
VNTNRLLRSATFIGPLVAIVVGAATASVRDEVGSTIVGVALAATVTVAALISRSAALTTALAAAVTFNYFHTEPYHSLRIHDPSDVVIVALLLGLGIAISDVTGWLRRRERFARQHAIADEAARQVLELLAVDRPISEIWPPLATSLLDELSFATCRYVSGTDVQMSIVADLHGRATDEQATFVLPAAGAAVAIHHGGRNVGFLVITPQHGHTALTVRRSVVLALAATVSSAVTAALGLTEPSTDSATGTDSMTRSGK